MTLAELAPLQKTLESILSRLSALESNAGVASPVSGSSSVAAVVVKGMLWMVILHLDVHMASHGGIGIDSVFQNSRYHLYT